jgi:hypothetical protein
MTKLGRIEARRKAVAGGIVERRRMQRAWVNLPARLRIPHLDVAFPCEVVNLSLTGVYVNTSAQLPQGTAVELELSPQDCLVPLQMRGRVVRQSSGDNSPGFGVAFSWVSIEATRLIKQAVARAPAC